MRAKVAVLAICAPAVVVSVLGCSAGVIDIGPIPNPSQGEERAPADDGLAAPTPSPIAEPQPGDDAAPAPTPSPEQTPNEPPTTPADPGQSLIYGHVVDALQPDLGIPQSYVYVPKPATGQGTAGVRQEVLVGDYSDDSGYYELRGVPAGDVTVVVEPPPDSGYQRIEIQTTLAPGQQMRLRITLVSEEVFAQLKQVIVSPSAAEVTVGQTLRFSAAVLDIYGNVQPIQPIWVVVGGGGTIDEYGVFRAGNEPCQTTVVAIAGRKTGTAAVSVVRPEFSVSPRELDFGSLACSQTLQIVENAGQLQWTLEESAPWLSVAPTSGSGSAAVAVSVSREGLEPGLYECALVLRTNGGTLSIPVRMEVSRTLIEIHAARGVR